MTRLYSQLIFLAADDNTVAESEEAGSSAKLLFYQRRKSSADVIRPSDRDPEQTGRRRDDAWGTAA